jgi:hypothetical protein
MDATGQRTIAAAGRLRGNAAGHPQIQQGVEHGNSADESTVGLPKKAPAGE